MAKKTVGFNKSGVSRLPQNKPVVYRIKTAAGQTNCIGIAKRGRAQERIQDHLSGGNIPGVKVEIEQKQSIQEARKTETCVIARTKPKYNKQS